MSSTLWTFSHNYCILHLDFLACRWHLKFYITSPAGCRRTCQTWEENVELLEHHLQDPHCSYPLSQCFIPVLQKGLTAVLAWLKRITGLAANYLLWWVRISKNQFITMRTNCLSHLSLFNISLSYFFPPRKIFQRMCNTCFIVWRGIVFEF